MRKLYWGASIAVAASFAVALLYLLLTKPPAPNNVPSQQRTVTVTVTEAQMIKHSAPIEAIGSLKAQESVTISVNVTEYVKKLFFDDGAYVEKDAPLVELASDEELAQERSAKARLIEAQANFNRIAKLVKRHHASKSEHDNLFANLKSAQAKLAEIQAKLGDRTIKAPFSGNLGFRLVSEGTLLEPGDKIVTLDKIVPIKVDFSLAERYLSHIKVGQSFKARSIAYPNTLFQGQITAIDSRLDEQTRSMKVRGRLQNREKKLKPGMLLKIAIQQKKETLLVIPESALLARGNERFIFIVKNQRAKKIPVEVLSRSHGQVQIKADIEGGTKVVVDGGFKLRNNSRVNTRHVPF